MGIFSAYMRAIVLCSIAPILSACASVDQFGSRVQDANNNSQDALNEETLLNIMRASRFQPLTFIAITQITGGQTETTTTGLPNIILAPSKSVQTGPYSFSNSIASGVTGGFQSNPLVSTTFQEGILSPTTARSIALLISSHPRDQVLYTVISSIRVTDTNDPTRTSLLVNDPGLDLIESGSDNNPKRDFDKCEKLVSTMREKDAKAGTDNVFMDGTICSYSKFTNLMRVLLDQGLTSELIASGSKPSSGTSSKSKPASNAQSGASDTGGSSSQLAKGHICFDITRGSPDLEKSNSPICGQNKASNKGSGIQASADINDINYIVGSRSVKISINTRSLAGIYSYLGSVYRNSPVPSGYESYSATSIPDSDKIINIVSDQPASGCLVAVNYQGERACVPNASLNTALIFDIVQNLRNLSIQASDLNSAFTVRLTNQ